MNFCKNDSFQVWNKGKDTSLVVTYVHAPYTPSLVSSGLRGDLEVDTESNENLKYVMCMSKNLLHNQMNGSKKIAK